MRRSRNGFGSNVGKQRVISGFESMSVKDVTKLYQHPHSNDGWAISGYKIPVANRINLS